MANQTRSEMDSIHIADFLQTQDTGVLALAEADEAYGVPVSFDYEPDRQAVYLRLGFGENSQKERFLEASSRVSFVVYDQTDEGWKSVVVQGTTETVAESSLDATIREALDDIRVPYYRVHAAPATETDFHIVRIDPDSVSGIVEG
jgi:nitroimidazol reductase NimA-like FMN-containing flavoprotein (pyridoxamine 5'-phosphate oxidase superfamily)